MSVTLAPPLFAAASRGTPSPSRVLGECSVLREGASRGRWDFRRQRRLQTRLPRRPFVAVGRGGCVWGLLPLTLSRRLPVDCPAALPWSWGGERPTLRA